MQPRSLGRPKDLKKRQSILQAAKNIFLEFGYDGASMDSIAQMAGVSKLTVYNHFNDKAQLFSAAIEMVCEQRLPKIYYQLDIDTDIYCTLERLGLAFLTMLYSAEAIKLTQLMTSLTNQNKELVHLFYHAGPERTRQNMQQFFQTAQHLNLLDINDAAQSADLFLTLLTGCRYDRVIWQVLDIPDTQQIENMLKQILTIFLKVHPIKVSNI